MKNQSLREALRVWRRKKRKPFNGTYLIDPDTGKKELWIPCKTFAKLVRRSYHTILDLARVKWIKAMEVGDSHASICMVPKRHAQKQFLQLQREGRIRK